MRKRTVASPRTLAEGHSFDFAASRAYYAMFYLAEAALLEQGLTFSKHSAVIAEFNRLLVRPGRIEREHYEALRAGLDARIEGDYGFEESFDEARARRLIDGAEAFVRAVEAHLRRGSG